MGKFRIWGKRNDSSYIVVILKESYHDSLRIVREMKNEGWKFQGRVKKNL